MKKYIVGFRSNKKRNKIIASIYYLFTGLIGISENLFTLTLLWMLPSLILNFTSMLKNNEDKIHNKKRFIKTLIVFIVAFIISTNLSSTGSAPQDNVDSSSTGQTTESKSDEQLKDVDNVEENEVVESTESNEEHKVNQQEETIDIESLEIGDTLETPLGMGEIKPVYNGIKTNVIGKYMTIRSSKNIKEEDLIEFKKSMKDKLDNFNWVVAEFGDGTALDLGYLPGFDYCNYSYDAGFTNMMGSGIIYDDKVEYSTDL